MTTMDKNLSMYPEMSISKESAQKSVVYGIPTPWAIEEFLGKKLSSLYGTVSNKEELTKDVESHVDKVLALLIKWIKGEANVKRVALNFDPSTELLAHFRSSFVRNGMISILYDKQRTETGDEYARYLALIAYKEAPREWLVLLPSANIFFNEWLLNVNLSELSDLEVILVLKMIYHLWGYMRAVPESFVGEGVATSQYKGALTRKVIELLERLKRDDVPVTFDSSINSNPLLSLKVGDQPLVNFLREVTLYLPSDDFLISGGFTGVDHRSLLRIATWSWIKPLEEVNRYLRFLRMLFLLLALSFDSKLINDNQLRVVKYSLNSKEKGKLDRRTREIADKYAKKWEAILTDMNVSHLYILQMAINGKEWHTISIWEPFSNLPAYYVDLYNVIPSEEVMSFMESTYESFLREIGLGSNFMSGEGTKKFTLYYLLLGALERDMDDKQDKADIDKLPHGFYKLSMIYRPPRNSEYKLDRERLPGYLSQEEINSIISDVTGEENKLGVRFEKTGLREPIELQAMITYLQEGDEL